MDHRTVMVWMSVMQKEEEIKELCAVMVRVVGGQPPGKSLLFLLFVLSSRQSWVLPLCTNSDIVNM